MGNLYTIVGFFDEFDGVKTTFGGYFITGDELSEKPTSKKDLRGMLADRWGNSNINGSMKLNTLLSFMKQYSNNLFSYRFDFDKDKKLWVGTWVGTYKLRYDHQENLPHLGGGLQTICKTNLVARNVEANIRGRITSQDLPLLREYADTE